MIFNIAHRGARSIAPENTLIAAEIGFRSGAHLWETDVRISKDQHLILFHDETLDRTTNVADVYPDRRETHVMDFTLEELKRLRPGKRFMETDPFSEIQKHPPEPFDREKILSAEIPTLNEALEFTRDLSWKINIELKVLPDEVRDFPLPDRVVASIHETGIPVDSVIISSFFHPWLIRVKEQEPGIETQALIGDDPARELDWGDYRFPIYNVNADMIDESDIIKAKSLGKRINLFTVNDTRAMLRYIDAGVDGIITDYPQRLAALLKGNKHRVQDRDS